MIGDYGNDNLMRNEIFASLISLIMHKFPYRHNIASEEKKTEDENLIF